MVNLQKKFTLGTNAIRVIVFVLFGILIVAVIASSRSKPEKTPVVVSPVSIEKIDASALARFPNQKYDLARFYADGVSTQFQAMANYTDIGIYADTKVQTIGDGRSTSCASGKDFLYNPASGILMSCRILRSNSEVIFTGIAK